MAKTFKASAPGSLMLLGEHAVLHGKHALVCAVDRRIEVTLAPRNDDRIEIASDLGRLATTVNEVRAEEPFRFVTAAIARARDGMPTGFDLAIRSAFSHKVGLGSSAAVTVAATAALAAWLGEDTAPQAIFDESIFVVRQTQGIGSGADVAASVFGGLVAYRAAPLEIRPLRATFPLTVIYSGSKRPTPEVVELVERARAARPGYFEAIFDLMDRSALEAAEAASRGEWEDAGALLNLNQGLMDALGVGNAVLSEIVYALRADAGILGSKISGSGLGDCVVGLGRAQRDAWPYEVLPVQITQEGVRVEAH